MLIRYGIHLGMRMEDVFLMGCDLGAFEASPPLLPFDKGSVPVLKKALFGELKNHGTCSFRVKLTECQ